MRLFIPEIGTRLLLEKPWTFRLHFEYRNENFGKGQGIRPPPPTPNRWGWAPSDPWWQTDEFTAFTLPEGTMLKVDRIYIRKGVGDYSSVTFYAFSPEEMAKGKSRPKSMGRFWAKLAEVNTIRCHIIEDPLHE